MKRIVVLAFMSVILFSGVANGDQVFFDDFSDPNLPGWVDVSAPGQNRLIWVYSPNGGEVTPEVDWFSPAGPPGGGAFHTFNEVQSTVIEFEAIVRNESNLGFENASDYVGIQLGSSTYDDFSSYGLIYGAYAGSPDNIFFRLYRRRDITGNTVDFEVLINLILPFDSNYHTISASRDLLGNWSLFRDGNLLGTAIDSTYMDFGGILVGANNRGGYITEVSVTTAPVPEPTTMLLLGSGLVAIAGFRKRNVIRTTINWNLN